MMTDTLIPRKFAITLTLCDTTVQEKSLPHLAHIFALDFVYQAC